MASGVWLVTWVRDRVVKGKVLSSIASGFSGTGSVVRIGWVVVVFPAEYP